MTEGHKIVLLVALALINELHPFPLEPSVATGLDPDTIRDMFGGLAQLTPAKLSVLSPEQIRVRNRADRKSQVRQCLGFCKGGIPGN